MSELFVQLNQQITTQNFLANPKFLQDINQFEQKQVILQLNNQGKYDIQIERHIHKQTQLHYIAYRYDKNKISILDFINQLNQIESQRKEKNILEMSFFSVLKDSIHLYIYFQQNGESLYEILQNPQYEINLKQAKQIFKEVLKSLHYIQKKNNLNENILTSTNIYLDIGQSEAKFLPIFLLKVDDKLDTSDLDQQIILAPETINNQVGKLQLNESKCNVYILGILFLQLLTKQLFGEFFRSNQVNKNPQELKIGPNDSYLQQQLDSIKIYGEKNKFVKILEQCVIYNIEGRIDIVSLHQMCKNHYIYQQYTQILTNNDENLQNEIKNAEIKKIHEDRIQNYEQVIQKSIDFVNKGEDINQIRQNFEQIKNEYDQLKQQYNIVVNQTNAVIETNFAEISNEQIENFNREKNNSGRSSSLKSQSIKLAPSRSNQFLHNISVQMKNIDSPLIQNKSSIIKIKKINNQSFLNPYGISFNNYSVINNSIYDNTQIISKYQQIIDNEITSVNCIIQVSDSLIATGGDDACIKIWNTDDPKKECIQTLIGHSNSIQSLCCLERSQEKKIIASGSCGTASSIKIWNIFDAACIKTLKGHDDTVSQICKLNDDVIISSSYDSTIKIWKWKQGKCEKTLKNRNFAVLCLCIIDKTYIASGSDDCEITVWNIRDGSIKYSIPAHNSWVQCILFVQKYNLIVSSSGDGCVKQWDINGQIVNKVELKSGQINCLIYVESKNAILAVGTGQKINIMNAENLMSMQVVDNAHKDSILSCVWENKYIFTGGMDGAINIWKVNEFENQNKNVVLEKNIKRSKKRSGERQEQYQIKLTNN